MNTLFKKMAMCIPRLRKLKNEVEYLKRENIQLVKGIIDERSRNSFLNFRINEVDRLHEELVQRNWGTSPSKNHLFCYSPFKRIEILPNGDIYTCCSAHLKHGFKIGNLYLDTMDEIWNSNNAKKLRYSVSEGDFEYCNHMCRWLHMENDLKDNRISPVRIRSVVNMHFKNYESCIMSEGPKEIALSCDETCNLFCPSCRTNRKALSKEKSNDLYQALIKKVRPMLISCKNLSALGSGDLFASSAISKFFKSLNKEEFPHLELTIITNAQLLTKKVWEEFSNLHDFPIDLVISVDAATKETYEKIRRGASWDVFENNMYNIREWKDLGMFRSLQMNFLVQADNYKEMTEFIEICRLWHADRVEFQRLANWGTFTEEEYAIHDVFNPTNKLYKEVSTKLNTICNENSGIEIIQNIL